VGRDLREHRRATDRRLIVGFVVLLLVVGDGLVYLAYGPAAALSGMLCMVGAVAIFGVLWLILFGLSRLADRIDR
jgi:hypothetical protein